jgi:hypothetical protein
MKNKEKFPKEFRISIQVADSLQKTVTRLEELMVNSLQTKVSESALYPAYSQQIRHLTNLLDAAAQKTGGSQTGKWTMEVPRLVVGSVLPANRVFQTVSGKTATADQQIQVSLEDYSAGNIAGHEAILGVLRQILAAVSDISISDETLAGAVQRRQEKMNVVKGGQW